MEITADSRSTSSGVGYCVWGVIALIVGIFFAGIPLGLAAAHLGNEGINYGSMTFGKAVRAAGWIEVIVTIIGLVAMLAGWNPRP
jgi:hypothetical protein